MYERHLARMCRSNRAGTIFGCVKANTVRSERDVMASDLIVKLNDILTNIRSWSHRLPPDLTTQSEKEHTAAHGADSTFGSCNERKRTQGSQLEPAQRSSRIGRAAPIARPVANAWGACGTRYSRRIHRAARSSPWRGNNNATSLRAVLLVGWPLKPSMARSGPPNAFGYVTAALDFVLTEVRTPWSATVGSTSARAVAIEYRHTVPIIDRAPHHFVGVC